MVKRRWGATCVALFAALALSSCARLIRESEIQDPPTVSQLARDLTESEKKLDFKGRRLAIIALSASSIATQARRDSALGILDTVSRIGEGFGALTDPSNSRSGQALNLAFASVVDSLKALGYDVMPPDQVWGNETYKAIPAGPHMYPTVKGSRLVLGDDNYADYGWFPSDRANASDADINKLFDALHVDGIVAAYFMPDSNLLKFGSMRLYVKGANAAQLAWRGRLKKEAAEVELPWAGISPNDEQRVAVTGRVYHHAFVLLANRMAMDMK